MYWRDIMTWRYDMKKKYDRISDDIRNKLHWLPIRQRISFKLCLIQERASPRGMEGLHRASSWKQANKVWTRFAAGSEAAFSCLRGEAPPYLSEMLSLVSDSGALRSHRSAARGDLIIPRTFTKTFGPRGFAVSGPTAWNALPSILENQRSVSHSL